MLERLLRIRAAKWFLPGGIAVLLLLLFLAGPTCTDLLRYERAAVVGGQAWRLLTCHLVHGDVPHLAWNLVGLGLVWLLFAREFSTAGWSVILLVSTAVIAAGFLLFEPALDWYVGFSGVLHGCMAAGLVAWLGTARDPLTLVVSALFVAKLLWEHAAGPLPLTGASLSLPVVYQAHSYGAAGGVLAAVWLLRRPGRVAPL
jgi:rhomboid family GlyGly-CTERM serine protease